VTIVDYVFLIFLFLSVISYGALNVAVQTAKRTINKWSEDILIHGKITSSESTDIGTVYGNPFSNWCIEIDREHKIEVLRNPKIREKIREFWKLKRIRRLFLLVFIVIASIRVTVRFYLNY